MQQPFPQPNLYFVIGDPKKTSFAIQFCRDNKFNYLPSPTLDQIHSNTNNCIIEGTLQLFAQTEKSKPQLSLIFLGTDYSNKAEKQLRMDYLKIGKCYDVPEVTYEAFRKALNSNLIFIFGPQSEQCYLASTSLANTIGYNYVFLPQGANDLILQFDKTKNYVINGFFTKQEDIDILESYFNVRVIHLKFERENLPKYDEYFDMEYDILPLVSHKSYYLCVDATLDPMGIMDDITEFLCPKLLFLNYLPLENSDYVNEYLEQTNGLRLSILEIQHIRKRKNLPLATNSYQSILRLTEIFYRDLNRKEILLADFPFETREFLELENMNRKISCFVNLSNPSTYQYTKNYSSPIYFLENQKMICPSMNDPLAVELIPSQQYWIVNGPGTCGKSTVAKFIASQFGFKHVDYEVQAAAAKEKIMTPEDGDELPVKKLISYFGNMVKDSPDSVFVFDGLTYEGKDLEEWVRVLGAPNVINLKVEANEQIKRTRKKNEADPAAEISQEESAKAAELIEKNSAWCENLCEMSPSSRVYQVDYRLPQLLAEPLIISILKPRIFLVQKNNHLTYQNIALRHNMGFINLSINTLEECCQIVKSCGKRDIIICGYQTGGSKMVSQEMYWIEKNLGEIRYLGIWNPEQKEIKEELMHLERPPVEEKPKRAEGEEEEEKQEEPEEGEDGPPKKKFDIFEHEWTKPSCHKNLSQWFFKLKKKVNERTCENPKSCYDSFSRVLEALNSDKETCIYETIQ